MDLHNATHYQRFTDALAAAGASHGSRVPQEKLAKMYEAQTLWDEYMAESAAKYMDSHPDSRLVVLAGASHVASRDGVPDRYTRRTGGSTFTVLPKSVP